MVNASKSNSAATKCEVEARGRLLEAGSGHGERWCLADAADGRTGRRIGGRAGERDGRTGDGGRAAGRDVGPTNGLADRCIIGLSVIMQTFVLEIFSGRLPQIVIQ